MTPLEELMFADAAQNYMGATAAPNEDPNFFQGGSELYTQPRFAPPREGLQPLQTRPGDISYRYATPQGQEELYGMPSPPDPRMMGQVQLPQVQNLGQLQAVLAKLKGVPDELVNEILSRAMGRPYVSPKQATLQNALLQAKATHALGAPARAEAAAGRAESRDIRREGMAQSQQSREAQLQLQQEMMEMRREAQEGRELRELETYQKLAESTLDPVLKNAMQAYVNARKSQLPGVAAMLGTQGQQGGGKVAAPVSARRTVLPNGITVTRGAQAAATTTAPAEHQLEYSPETAPGERLGPLPSKAAPGNESYQKWKGNVQFQQEKRNLAEGARQAILTRARELASRAGMNPMAPEIFLTPYIRIAQQELARKQQSQQPNDAYDRSMRTLGVRPYGGQR